MRRRAPRNSGYPLVRTPALHSRLHAVAHAWLLQPISNANRAAVAERLVACASRWFAYGNARRQPTFGLLPFAEGRVTPGGLNRNEHPFAVPRYYAIEIPNPEGVTGSERALRPRLTLEPPPEARRPLEAILPGAADAYLAGTARTGARPGSRPRD